MGEPGDDFQSSATGTDGLPSQDQLSPETAVPGAVPPPVIEVQPSAEVSRVAEDSDLGALRQSAVHEPVDRPAPPVQFFEYEHGLVVQKQDEPPLAFRWDRSAVRSHEGIRSGGIYGSTEYWHIITRDDGVTAVLDGIYKTANQVRRKFRQEVLQTPAYAAELSFVRFAGQVAGRVAAAQLLIARAALRRGEELDFGRLAISPAGLRAGRRHLIPWPEVRWVRVEKKWVKVKRVRRPGAIPGPWCRDVNNFPVFLALTEEILARQAAGQDAVPGDDGADPQRRSVPAA